MPAMVVDMAFRQEDGEPWWRVGNMRNLGTALTGKISAGGMAEAAGMLYQMQMFPMDVRFPDGTYRTTPDAAIYSNRSGEWEYINSVKRAANYQIVQNAEIAEILDQVAEGKPAISELFDMTTAGILNDGKQTFFCLKMGEDTVKLGVDGDDHYVTYTLIFNDMSGNGQLQWAISSVRTVCINTAFIALNQAEEKGTLWTFPHRSNPLAMLKYRAELERHLQVARIDYYARLQRLVSMNWDDAQVDTFVNKVYPEPPTPKKVKQRDAGVGLGLPAEIFNPVNDMATTAEKQHAANVERFSNYRESLKELVYANAEAVGMNAYAGYQAGTEFVNWRVPERGSWGDVAASVMLDSRRVEMVHRVLGIIPSKKKGEAMVVVD
jgi:hypothetical protein